MPGTGASANSNGASQYHQITPPFTRPHSTSLPNVNPFTHSGGGGGGSNTAIGLLQTPPGPRSGNSTPSSTGSPMLGPSSPGRDDPDDDGPASSRGRRSSHGSSPYSPANASSSTTGGTKVIRKLRKNNREKQRRSELNDKFERLCDMLHLGQKKSKTAEKFTILSEAIALISSLRSENAELRV